MNKQLDTLLQREVTRKEFIATLGFGVASLMGVGSLIKLVNPSFGSSITKHVQGSNTYGSSSYGG